MKTKGPYSANIPGVKPSDNFQMSELFSWRNVYRWLPRRLRRVVRWEAILLWRLAVQSLTPSHHHRLRAIQSQRDLQLNLGALNTGRPGWVNVDAINVPGIDFICDLRKPIPLPSACAKCIFSEHLLEHFEYPEEPLLFLKECRRLLKPGGILRLIVPDALKYCRALVAKDWEMARLLRDTKPYQTLMEMLNDVFRQNGEHLYAYDEETLRRLLKSAGFTEIRKTDYGKSLMEGLAMEQQWRAEESLCMEAVKAKPDNSAPA